MIWRPNELGKEVGIPDAESYGVIAQELEAQFPDLVHPMPQHPGGVTDLKGVDYTYLSPVLIEAIKDLDNKLTDIENQLNSGS